MDTKEALKSFELDARLFYDAIAFSTDDYLYIIDMQRDIALVSDNMRDDFDLPDSLVPGLIPLWRELIVERDRKRFDDSIDSMLSGETDCPLKISVSFSQLCSHASAFSSHSCASVSNPSKLSI